jgi:scyllo-inositol 2-dehydrogenase (NADP+)
MTEHIGVAVVGLGESGDYLHCRPISRLPELYELRGVFDPVAQLCQQVAAKYGVSAYPTWEALLADPGVSLAVIATPTKYHKDLAIAALQAGKNVVVEKPMAMDASEAEAMIAEAERRGLVLTVHKNRRWYAEFRTVRRILEEGLLGRVFSITKRTSGPPPAGGERETWRSHKAMGGGLLNEMGSHLVDQVLLLVPSKVERLLGTTKHVFTRERDDFFEITLWFADGTLGHIQGYSSVYLPQPMWYIQGIEGTLISDQDNNWGKMTLVRRSGDLILNINPDPLEGGIEQAGRFFYTSLAGTLLRGEELAVKPRQVLRVVQVLDAARQSAQIGEVMHVNI